MVAKPAKMAATARLAEMPKVAAEPGTSLSLVAAGGAVLGATGVWPGASLGEPALPLGTTGLVPLPEGTGTPEETG